MKAQRIEVTQVVVSLPETSRARSTRYPSAQTSSPASTPIRGRKTAADVLSFIGGIRNRYPKEVHLYLVIDNLSAHWTPEICSWAVGNQCDAGPRRLRQPPQRIECLLWAFVEYVVRGSDHAEWDTFGQATQLYLERKRRAMRPTHPGARKPADVA